MFESKLLGALKERYQAGLEDLLRLYPKGLKHLYRQFPELKHGYKTLPEGQTPETGALIASMHVLCHIFEQSLSLEQRAVLREELRSLDWDKARASVATWGSEDRQYDFGDVHYGTIAIAYSYLAAEKLEQHGRIESGDFTEFMDYIDAMLEGLNADERERRKYNKLLDEVFDTPALREDDDEPLLPPWRAAAALPELCGSDCEVELQETALGIALIDKKSGRSLSERRNLSQDLLKKVPGDLPPYRFVNLTTADQDQCSCLIYGPENEVVGDMRAFWWSFAKTTVHVNDFTVSGTRFSQPALDMLRMAARTAWDLASEHDNIDEMRNMPSYRRNTHFEALNRFQAKADSEAQKLGIEIALAFVLAVASEDRSLERHAFLRFKEFLWLPGDEPAEFYQHLGG